MDAAADHGEMESVALAHVPELSSLGLDINSPFTWEQAREKGVARKVLVRLVAEGTLHRWFRSVYVHKGIVRGPLARAQALSLVVPPSSVVVDRSAAWLLGVDAKFPWEKTVELPLEVFRAEPGARLRRTDCSSGERGLAAHDITDTGGVLHTTALRTALDLGRFLRRDRALAAMDALSRVGCFRGDVLRDELPRFRGYRGVIQLRALAAVVDPLAESPGESRLRLSWLDAGLPMPLLQHRVASGDRVAYLDIADPVSKFAAEYDGEEWHSAPGDRVRDMERRNWLKSLGWHVEVLTKSDYSKTGPVPEARLGTAYRRVALHRGLM